MKYVKKFFVTILNSFKLIKCVSKHQNRIWKESMSDKIFTICWYMILLIEILSMICVGRVFPPFVLVMLFVIGCMYDPSDEKDDDIV